MKSIRRGFEITASVLRTMFTKMFQYINEIDTSYVTMTTGQIICEKTGCWSDSISVHSDQYFKTDIMLSDTIADTSYLQRYLDELDRIERGV